MHETLGLMLVHDGLITRPQLYEALRFQSVNGKQLGTCLLLLGFIRPEQLLPVLARQIGIPYVEPGVLERAPLATLLLCPLAVAEPYRAVAFNASADGMIDLAFSNSVLLGQLGLVASALGAPVRAFLALELEVEQALERLRQATTSSLATAHNHITHAGEEPRGATLPILPGFHLVTPQFTADGHTLLQEMHEDALPEMQTAPGRAPQVGRPDDEISSANFGTALGLETEVSTDEIVLLKRPVRISASVQDASLLARTVRPQRKPDTESRLARISMYTAAERIYEAATFEDICRLVAQCLLSYFSRCALLQVEAGVMRLQVADGFERLIKDVPALPIASLPALASLAMANQTFYGRSTDGQGVALVDEVLSLLRVRRPATALVVPLATRSRGLTFFAYADNEDLSDLYEDINDVAILFKETQTAIDLMAAR